MSIVTFWSDGKEQTGKTISMIALATHIAIEHNYKILVISTSFGGNTIDRCFWRETKKRKNFGLFGPNTNVAIQEGIEGIAKIMKSNRLTPERITDYSKIIFKGRLEILPNCKSDLETYKDVEKIYPDVINLANNYYDLVFVDLDNETDEKIRERIINSSDLIVANISQRLYSIDNFMENKEKMPILDSKKAIVLIGRHDRFSKYTAKNISRYMKEKNNVLTIPYNTLFFEACEEGEVPDFFLKLRKISDDDRNKEFINEVRRAANNILYRLEDLKIKR